MIQQRTIPQKAGLLVSVRSMEEAMIAHDSNVVAIIDVKEPDAGSLGCVSIEVAQQIADALPPKTQKSIALGEVVDWPSWPSADKTLRNEILSNYHFTKIGLSGLAGCNDWVEQWNQCLSEIPEAVRRVAVAYADAEIANSPSIESVTEEGANLGCKVLLIDTFTKGQGSLFDFLSPKQLAKAIGMAKQRGMKVVLAGSLSCANIPQASLLCPDLIAVRGAACVGARDSSLQKDKIREVASTLGVITVSSTSIPPFPKM